jgi:hypothetical protein
LNIDVKLLRPQTLNHEGEVKKRMVDAIQLKTAEERWIQQGVQQTVLRQMVGRMGDVPANLASRLQNLSIEDLDDLSLALFDFNSYADVERWLTRH